MQSRSGQSRAVSKISVLVGGSEILFDVKDGRQIDFRSAPAVNSASLPKWEQNQFLRKTRRTWSGSAIAAEPEFAKSEKDFRNLDRITATTDLKDRRV